MTREIVIDIPTIAASGRALEKGRDRVEFEIVILIGEESSRKITLRVKEGRGGYTLVE